jgi:hypothetical protein
MASIVSVDNRSDFVELGRVSSVPQTS